MFSLVTLTVALVAAYLIAECINLLIVGDSLTRGIYRVFRQRLHRSTDIALPEDLKLAIANGLLSVGSEVVVGAECEWTGSTVSRFAVAPHIVDQEPGMLMKVIRLTQNRIELKPIGRTGIAPRKQGSEQVISSNDH